MNTRFESQLSRINCQTFSCGFSSGHFAGSETSVMFEGTGESLRSNPDIERAYLSTAPEAGER